MKKHWRLLNVRGAATWSAGAQAPRLLKLAECLSRVAVCVCIFPFTYTSAADPWWWQVGRLEEPGVAIVLNLLWRLWKSGVSISLFAFVALILSLFGTFSCPGLQTKWNETLETRKLRTCCQHRSQWCFCCRNCPDESWLLHHPVHGGAS